MRATTDIHIFLFAETMVSAEKPCWLAVGQASRNRGVQALAGRCKS